MNRLKLLALFIIFLISAFGTSYASMMTISPDTVQVSGDIGDSNNQTDQKKSDELFKEAGYRIGEISSVDIPHLLMAEKRFYSPDKKKFIKVVVEYNPEDHWTLEDSPIIKIFFDEKLLLESTMLIRVGDRPFLNEEVVWIDDEKAAILGRYLYNAQTQKTEDIDFSNMAIFKNNGSIQDRHSGEALYGQIDEREHGDIYVYDYAVSPDKKNILYRCLDWSDIEGRILGDESHEKEFFTLYNIKEKSFRILYEQTLLIDSPIHEFNPLWKDNDNVIVNTIDLNSWYSQKVDISVGKATPFSDTIVTNMTSDGKYWVSERKNTEDETITDVLCSEDGVEHKLYEELEWSSLQCRFLNKRYFEVYYPKEYTIIDEVQYVSTVNLYDLENMVFYRINFMEPIWEKYGENTKLELLDYTIEGNKVLFSFAEFPLYESYDKNKKRNGVQFEVELLPESSIALGAPSSWAESEVSQAVELGLIPSELQSAYQGNCTREDFCTLAIRLVEVKFNKTILEILSDKRLTPEPSVFTDTRNSVILAANALGIVNGVGDNRFDPSGLLTREQAATMLMRTANVFSWTPDNSPISFADSGNISPWAAQAVDFVTTAGVMGGVGNNMFSPRGNYTREMAFLTMLRMYNIVSAKSKI